jgi:hypothetical protein
MKTLLVALALGAALTAAPAHADVKMCEQSAWVTTCRNPDGTWVACGLHGPECEPLALTGQPALPGMTPAP